MASEQTSKHRDASFVPHALPHDHAHFEKLRRKLRWQMLVAYATPLVLISTYFYYQYSSTMRKEVHAHLKSVAESQRNTIDLYLKERVVNVSSIFRAGVLNVPSDDANMMEVLSEPMRSKHGTVIYLCGARGRVALTLPTPPKPPLYRGNRIRLPKGAKPSGKDKSGAPRIRVGLDGIERVTS